MKLRKVAELPARSRSSVYDPIVEEVKRNPKQVYALETDLKNPSQLAQELKKKGIQANVRDGVLYLKA